MHQNDNFCNPQHEKIVIIALCEHGHEFFYEIDNIINEDCFRKEVNRVIFRCIKKIFENNEAQIDFPTIEAAANSLGLINYFDGFNYEYFKSLLEEKVEKRNAIVSAKIIRKLKIAKDRYFRLEEAQNEYLKVTGEEPTLEILGIAEDAAFDLDSLKNEDESPKLISEGFTDLMNQLKENDGQIGISSGFPRWDAAIGGGLRKGSVSVIGARMKQGKSMIGMAISKHVASMGIPTLTVDTEMTKDEVTIRLVSNISRIKIGDIENGSFAKHQEKRNKLYNAYKKIEKMPYYHKKVTGYSWEEQISVIRSWIMKAVGLNNQGLAKPCLIILDYLKLMDHSEINNNTKEYQLLGFMMTSLHNFSVKYQVPILTFVQLNRDGISTEETSVVSQSDRIGWLCSNLSIFKSKSHEEMDLDGPHNGNKKLVPLIARHGPGINDGDYINCVFEKEYADIREGKRKIELERARSSGFEYE